MFASLTRTRTAPAPAIVVNTSTAVDAFWTVHTTERCVSFCGPRARFEDLYGNDLYRMSLCADCNDD